MANANKKGKDKKCNEHRCISLTGIRQWKSTETLPQSEADSSSRLISIGYNPIGDII